MKTANSVKISVFAKEDEDQVKEKLLQLIPFNLEKEEINLNQKNIVGFNEEKIKTFEIFLTKEKHIDLFLESLISKLSKETKDFILKYIEKRLDEECNLFLRFSKDKLIKENELWLTGAGNCFHIKINIAVFPKSKENAIEIVRKVLKI